MTRVLHAGLHKTGSTFLQRHFFPRLSGVSYLGSYQLNKGAVVASDDLIMLFSSEASCGYPYPMALRFSVDRLEANLRVLSIDKVILVRRQFASWVLSLYFQTLNERNCWSLHQFIETNAENLVSWQEADEQAKSLCKRLKLEILVVSHEDLSAEPQRTCDRMADFIGCARTRVVSAKENSSRSGTATITVYRLMNWVCKSKILWGCFRVLGTSPRGLISGRFGATLERMSRQAITSVDAQRILDGELSR